MKPAWLALLGACGASDRWTQDLVGTWVGGTEWDFVVGCPATQETRYTFEETGVVTEFYRVHYGGVDSAGVPLGACDPFLDFVTEELTVGVWHTIDFGDALGLSLEFDEQWIWGQERPPSEMAWVYGLESVEAHTTVPYLEAFKVSLGQDGSGRWLWTSFYPYLHYAEPDG